MGEELFSEVQFHNQGKKPKVKVCFGIDHSAPKLNKDQMLDDLCRSVTRVSAKPGRLASFLTGLALDLHLEVCSVALQHQLSLDSHHVAVSTFQHGFRENLQARVLARFVSPGPTRSIATM